MKLVREQQKGIEKSYKNDATNTPNPRRICNYTDRHVGVKAAYPKLHDLPSVEFIGLSNIAIAYA